VCKIAKKVESAVGQNIPKW